MAMHRFDIPRGMPVAIDPRAIGASYHEPPKLPTHSMRDGVAVVDVVGPIAARGGWWCDSYESIRERMTAAIAARPKAVVMRLDSPGGDVAGLFETARDLRAMAAAARVPLVAYVDGMACSAGYALACAAGRIYAPATALLGSIGVIASRWDESEALTQHGVKISLITSGERKADGHPSQPMSETERGATQSLVNDYAGLFFAWVAESRPALSVDSVRGLQAGVLLGQAAVNAGLADEIATFDDVIAAASGAARTTTPSAAARGRTATRIAAMDMDKIRKLLGLPDDASDEDVQKLLEEKLAPEPEPEPDAKSEEELKKLEDEKKKAEDDAKAMAAKAASMEAAAGSLSEQVAALRAEVESLRPLRAEKVQRDREALIDGAMSKRGMKSADQRARFLAVAEKHGNDAALAAIDASHVPPASAPSIAKPQASRGDAPEGAGSDTSDQNEALRLATDALRAEQPTLTGPDFHRAALARARKDYPRAFSRAAKN